MYRLVQVLDQPVENTGCKSHALNIWAIKWNGNDSEN